MKQAIIFFILFVTMTVLTSSKEDALINETNQCLKGANTCSQKCNDYATNIPVNQSPVVTQKGREAVAAPVDDNEISLSPISRFILLQ